MFFSERTLHAEEGGKIAEAIADLRAKGWTAPAISKAEYPDYFDMLPFTFDDYVKSVLTPNECVSPGNLCQ